MVSQEVSFMFSITIILEFKVEKQTEKEVNWSDLLSRTMYNAREELLFSSHHLLFSVDTSEVKKQL